MTTSTDPILRYFDRAADPDLDAYFAQFAPDALVEDEGHEYRGIDAIRRWRTSVPSVRYTVLETDDGEDGVTTARVDISGDFPGSPVVLTFRFGFDAEHRIRLLTIRA